MSDSLEAVTSPELFNPLEVGPCAGGLFAGYYTLQRKDTGTHQTYQVRKVAKGSLAGKTILCLGKGYLDAIGFAFINDDGSVRVWGKTSRNNPSLQLEKHARAFEYVVCKGNLGGCKDVVEVMLEKRCVVCQRTLTHPESIRAGIGPECAKR